MIIERQQDVTIAATSVMERTTDPRLREIMVSLIKHLHGFIRDVRLTEAEFREATAVLGEMGKLSTDTHNEISTDGRLARSLVARMPSEQWRSGQYRNGAIVAWAFLAAALSSG